VPAVATDEELRAEEDAVTRTVDAVLREVAAEIARELEAADEITAAAFSLRRIGELWSERVPTILRRLFRVGQRAARDTSDAVLEGDLPEGFDRLEERYEDGMLPPAMAAYRDQTTALLEAVGERITQDAARELAEGLALGEDTEALRARLLAVLSRDGSQLGESRARRIAATEATRAWNAAADATVLAAELPPGTVLTKTWRTREDNRVREAHAEVDRTSVPAQGVFTVGGYAMRFPGDPTAPASLTVNCRCVLDYERQETASVTAATDPTGESMDEDEVTTEHTGAMIALVPTEADTERLALSGDGALPPEELHLTLLYLGEAGTWPAETRAALIDALKAGTSEVPQVSANLFGVAAWNPQSDDPAWIWSTGDGGGSLGIADARALALGFAEETAADLVPVQHTPFVAHVTGAYSKNAWPLDDMLAKLGPVTFDRLRVAFAGAVTDIPLKTAQPDAEATAADYPVRTWSTPGDTALAYENEKTGDGRLFAPGAIYWEGAGPWPLQYCDRMGMGHDGAALAGGIQKVDRDGGRIPGSGVLYMTQNAGWEAATLLDQGAPLGVSVDLDDVTVDVVDHTATEGSEDVAEVSFSKLSVMAASGGGWIVSATARPTVTASASGVARSSRTVEFTASANGGLSRAVARAVLGGELTAAAGDEDSGDAPVYTESPDDYTMRIMKGRLRGATLVPIPAFAGARIVIDPIEETVESDLVQEDVDLAASETEAGPEFSATAGRVVAHVRSTPNPVTPAEVAEALGISVVSARRHLREAAEAGRLLRHGRHYVGATLAEGEILASVTGDTDLPVMDRDTPWDGDAAKTRVFEWATDANGDVDPGMLGMAFLYLDDEADPTTQAAWKLGFADYVDGQLRIVPEAVFAIAGALNGARGGVDVPEEDMAALRERTEDLYETVGEALGEDDLRAPWDRDDEMTASAWRAMQDLPPMPAEWFREPTAEELPPGSGGVHCEGGRVFGWVAQRGVPHAVHGRSVTIEKLAGSRGLDYSHFLRKEFKLDDGSTVRAGAFTMNVGHHRDGYECETAACQFDDSRTVGAVVTVGMNEGGLWFSGAAGPWLAEWDRRVFSACQPSYHCTQNADGRWALKAVLTVPVPGHSSPLVASVIDRANLALTASAWGAGDHVQAEAAALAATIGIDGPDQERES
jgi:2'-5' RNA ligase